MTDWVALRRWLVGEEYQSTIPNVDKMTDRQYIKELEDRGWTAAETITQLTSDRKRLQELNDALNLRLVELEAILSMHKMLDEKV